MIHSRNLMARVGSLAVGVNQITFFGPSKDTQNVTNCRENLCLLRIRKIKGQLKKYRNYMTSSDFPCSAIQFDISCDTSSGNCYWHVWEATVLTFHLCWHSTWHTLWQSIWPTCHHSIWHSIWHTNWHIAIGLRVDAAIWHLWCVCVCLVPQLLGWGLLKERPDLRRW